MSADIRAMAEILREELAEYRHRRGRRVPLSDEGALRLMDDLAGWAHYGYVLEVAWGFRAAEPLPGSDQHTALAMVRYRTVPTAPPLADCEAGSVEPAWMPDSARFGLWVRPAPEFREMPVPDRSRWLTGCRLFWQPMAPAVRLVRPLRAVRVWDLGPNRYLVKEEYDVSDG